jgi:phage head maturation protease
MMATKTEDGTEFPASDYCYVPDPDSPSTWKLRITATPGGAPDAGIVGAAAAALGSGFRGQRVEIPDADRAAAVACVRTAWRKANPDRDDSDMPEGIATRSDATDEPDVDIVEEAAALLRSVVFESEVTVRNLAKREIDVRIAPFGTAIETNRGPEIIEPGAFRGVDPSKILLMGLEHEVHLGLSQDGRVIPVRRPTGKALSIDERSDAAYGTFRVAKTASGDEMLALADEGVIGGVSVEMGGNARVRTERHNGRRTNFVEFADLRAVSPTYHPAYAEARVLAVRSHKEDAPVATEEKAPATGATDNQAAAAVTNPPAEDRITAVIEQAFANVQTRASTDALAIQEKILDRLNKVEEESRASFQIPSAPEKDEKPDDFHSGEWMQLILRAMSGDRIDNRELQNRVAADLVTADNLGVVPPMFTGDVRETIDTSRPFLESTRRLNIPRAGMQLTVPVLTTRPTVGVQAEEKDELTSTITEITPANFDPTTIGGYGDISLQLLKRSDPSYLELYLDLLSEAYGIDADDRAVDALLAGVGINAGGTLDPDDAALGTAWANAAAVSRRLTPDRIWLSSAAVAAFIDAKASGTNAPLYSNLQANFTAGGGAGGLVSGLRPVHVPALDDEAVDIIVGPSRGFGWAEDGTYTLQVDVPARAGRDVGLIGMLWFAPLYPAAFTTFTLPS